MKIESVVANARKREVELKVGENAFTFPYARLRVVPTSDDPIVHIFADPELGHEAFTYKLDSGREDTVHLDAVREVNLDPDYFCETLLHRLSMEAKAGLEKSGLGKRQVARQLKTSPAQLYRLLDPGDSTKSLRQLIHLLLLVGRRVEFTVVPGDKS